MRRVARWTVPVLGWMVTLGFVGALAAGVLVPRVAGATPYVILTGSMSPGMPPGTLVVVRPVPAERITVGQVVTYQLVSGEPEVVTHRVVAISSDREGKPVFRTRGDANAVADRTWVLPAQIRGERWYAVPWLGHLGAVLDPARRQLVSVVVAFGLLGYAASVAVRGWRRRARRTSPEPTRAPAHV